MSRIGNQLKAVGGSGLNEAAGIRSSIIEKIAKHAEEVGTALRAIAKALGADSFSMSVSVPVGLAVSLTYNVAGAAD